MNLANPGWAGKLGIAPGETDFQPTITSLAWLKAVRSNAGSHIDQDNETLTSEVDTGQVEIGLIDPHYGYRMHAQAGAGATHSAPHHLAAGDPGYVPGVSGAGILPSSGAGHLGGGV